MPKYTDGRLVARGGELYHAADLVSRHFTSEWLRANMNTLDLAGSRLNQKSAQELITIILQAMNTKRLGEAEESIARHSDGRTARRYYSEALGKLQWLITKPPSDKGLEVDAVDELPANEKWEVVYSAPWKVDGYR